MALSTLSGEFGDDRNREASIQRITEMFNHPTYEGITTYEMGIAPADTSAETALSDSFWFPRNLGKVMLFRSTNAPDQAWPPAM